MMRDVAAAAARDLNLGEDLARGLEQDHPAAGAKLGKADGREVSSSATADDDIWREIFRQAQGPPAANPADIPPRSKVAGQLR